MPTKLELQRQYRLVKQMVSMHQTLSEDYLRRARVAEATLLVVSVFFAATTFAGMEFYEQIPVRSAILRWWIGLASLVAFSASLLLLLFDWKGESARHRAAGESWSETLALFRERRRADKTWPDEAAAELNDAYWVATRYPVSIPDSKFNSLKARYLLKVEISKRVQANPGSPVWAHRFAIGLSSTWKALKGPTANE